MRTTTDWRAAVALKLAWQVDEPGTPAQRGWRDLDELRRMVRAQDVPKHRLPAASTLLGALARLVSRGHAEIQIDDGAGRAARWRWKGPDAVRAPGIPTESETDCASS